MEFAPTAVPTAVVSRHTSWLFHLVPLVYFLVPIVVATIIPVLSAYALPFAEMSDMLGGGFILALSGFVISLGALDAASTYGRMGSSRARVISLLSEPVLWWRTRIRSARQVEVWVGGIDYFTLNYQYTATSYANPLRVIFGTIYQPKTDAATNFHASRYFRTSVTYRGYIVPVFDGVHVSSHHVIRHRAGRSSQSAPVRQHQSVSGLHLR